MRISLVETLLLKADEKRICLAVVGDDTIAKTRKGVRVLAVNRETFLLFSIEFAPLHPYHHREGFRCAAVRAAAAYAAQKCLD